MLVNRDQYVLSGRVVKDPARAVIVGVVIDANAQDPNSPRAGMLRAGLVMKKGANGKFVPWDGTGKPYGILADPVYIEENEDKNGFVCIGGWVNQDEICVASNDADDLNTALHYLSTHGFIGIEDPL